MARSPRDVATEIVQRLSGAGHVAYFAGGCVRDELLRLHPKDYDVATDATPDEVGRLFPNVREVGKAFGVMLVRRGGVTTEVTTFRSEGTYTDGRRPDAVEFCDAKKDSQRRDFTINALFIDPLDGNGAEVIDYVGGVADLERRTIRAVGDPARRLGEDHLRALRAVRFAARLGFEIEPSTRRAIVEHASELAGVSRERIGEELRMMLGHESRPKAIALIEAMGLDAPVLNESAQSSQAQDRPLVGVMPKDADLPLLLAAWAVDRAGGELGTMEIDDRLGRWRRALCLSNDERDALRGILEGARSLVTQWVGASVAQRKRASSSRWYEPSMVLVGLVEAAKADEIRSDVMKLAATPSGLAPERLVSGDDLIDAGFEPGPEFTVLLEAAYDAQLEGQIRVQAEAMELIQELAHGKRAPKG